MEDSTNEWDGKLENAPKVKMPKKVLCIHCGKPHRFGAKCKEEKT